MTGNTEKIAKGMYEALAGQDVTLKKVEELDPLTLNSYDLVLLGSGIYAARFHKTVKKLLKATEELPLKVALFYTHATIDSDIYHPFPRNIRKIIEKGGCTICAEFECLGETKNVSEEARQQQLQSMSPEERKKAEAQMAQLKGHPNTEDLENAKQFAKSLL